MRVAHLQYVFASLNSGYKTNHVSRNPKSNHLQWFKRKGKTQLEHNRSSASIARIGYIVLVLLDFCILKTESPGRQNRPLSSAPTRSGATRERAAFLEPECSSSFRLHR